MNFLWLIIYYFATRIRAVSNLKFNVNINFFQNRYFGIFRRHALLAPWRIRVVLYGTCSISTVGTHEDRYCKCIRWHLKMMLQKPHYSASRKTLAALVLHSTTSRNIFPKWPYPAVESTLRHLKTRKDFFGHVNSLCSTVESLVEINFRFNVRLYNRRKTSPF